MLFEPCWSCTRCCHTLSLYLVLRINDDDDDEYTTIHVNYNNASARLYTSYTDIQSHSSDILLAAPLSGSFTVYNVLSNSD